MCSLRGSGEASQRKWYFPWDLNNEQGLGKEDGVKCNRLCIKKHSFSVWGNKNHGTGGRAVDGSAKDCLCQTSEQTLLDMKQKKVNNHLIGHL